MCNVPATSRFHWLLSKTNLYQWKAFPLFLDENICHDYYDYSYIIKSFSVMCQILKMSSIMSQSKLPISNFISTYTHSPTSSKGLLEGEGAGVRYVPLAYSVALASGFGRRVDRTGRGVGKF